MRSGAPWHVKGVHPDVRDNAREAARRAGMSVGEWLNTVIIDSTDEDDGYYDDSYLSRRRPRGDHGVNLNAITDRLDGLTDEIERLALASTTRREVPQDDVTARKLADAIAKLDRRVEIAIQESRSATEALGQKVESVDRALSALGRERFHAATSDWADSANTDDWSASVDRACDEIARRQRELEGEVFAPAAAPSRESGGPASEGLGRDEFSAIHERLRHVTEQIEAFGAARMGEAIDSLRNDLTDIAGKLIEASPRRAIETLEGEVRQLAARVDEGMRAGQRGAELSGIETGLAEVREAIRGLTPAESLSGAVEAIRIVSRKIDEMAAGMQEPGGIAQLETAIAGLRGVVARVASDDSLAALTAEIRALSDRVDTSLASAGSNDILRTLEQRISTIADAIETVRVSTGNANSSALETAVRSLSDKIDRMQAATEPQTASADLGAMIGSLGDRIDRIQVASAAPPPTDHLGDMIGSLSDKIENLRAARGDSDILRQIEERIGRLSEKLEASEAKLGNIDNIEKGMTELLSYIEGLRGSPPPAPVADAPPVQRIVDDVMRTQESLEAAHGTIGDVVDRLAMIETGMRGNLAPPLVPDEPAVPSPPVARPKTSSAMPAQQAARAAAASSKASGRPAKADEILPYDQPLEPGSGKPRPGLVAPAQASALERIAASKAVAEPVRTGAPDADPKSSFIVAARRAAQAAAEDDSVLTSRGSAEPDDEEARQKASGSLFSRHIKSLIVGTSVVVVAAGAVHVAFNFLNSHELPGEMPRQQITVTDPALSSRSAPLPGSSGVLSDSSAIGTSATPSAGVLPQPALAPVVSAPIPAMPVPPENTSTVPLPAAAATPDVTGALVQPQWPSGDTAPAAMSLAGQPVRTPPLPAAIGSKILIAAAESGDASAAYEVATRFADGRGVPLNPEAAAVWFERAANDGVVPAIFRLGGMFEKGIGVKKDLNKARELYTTAASRGSAKAMHNLAVLYADGFDGKPDYATAIQWFRKAGARGVPDSQYNLGVLYARGIGVEQNLGESYRWFALAAQSGDQDAAQKRDDVGKRLDPQTLNAVRSAVQGWTPEPQPDDAVTVKTPPGGWDPAAAPAAKGKPKRV